MHGVYSGGSLTVHYISAVHMQQSLGNLKDVVACLRLGEPTLLDNTVEQSATISEIEYEAVWIRRFICPERQAHTCEDMVLVRAKAEDAVCMNPYSRMSKPKFSGCKMTRETHACRLTKFSWAPHARITSTSSLITSSASGLPLLMAFNAISLSFVSDAE